MNLEKVLESIQLSLPDNWWILCFVKLELSYGPAFVDTGSLIDQVNYIASMDQHHNYMFDPENLVNTLKKAPFSDVRLREFDEKLDLKSRDLESIYASAIKW